MAWKEDDVLKTVTNPVYAGIGPYPAAVPEEQWLQATAQLIEKHGAKKVLRAILANLREVFPTEEGRRQPQSGPLRSRSHT